MFRENGDSVFIRDCEPSSGTTAAVVAATVYIIASLLNASSPRRYGDVSSPNFNAAAAPSRTFTTTLMGIINRRHLHLPDGDDDGDVRLGTTSDCVLISTPNDEADPQTAMDDIEVFEDSDEDSDLDEEPFDVRKSETFNTDSTTHSSLNPDDEVDEDEDNKEHEIVFRTGELEDNTTDDDDDDVVDSVTTTSST